MSRINLLCFALIMLLVSCSPGSEDQPSTTPPAPTEATIPTETAAPTVSTEACSALVETALAAVDASCQSTGRNQVCYGNILLHAVPREGIAALAFERPGDIANLDDIRTVELSPLNTITHEWGVALMKLQANLPDSLPGQNVTFLLFGDVELENVTEEGANVQAFYFRTGVGDAPCEAAPDSGILVQTPAGVTEVAMRMNGVDITLGSTAYLQAQAGSDLSVSVVEGRAEITAQGETRVVAAGNRTQIPMDADLNPAGPPSPPQPYQGAEVRSLPVNNLERPIHIVTVALASAFASDAEGWTIFGDGSPIEHFPADDTSDGYICSTDQDTGIGWYFQAPESWLGDQSGAYGGSLAYSLRQPSTQRQYDAPDVILEGGGFTLNYDTSENPGEDWTEYDVSLREDAGWIRADTRAAPTQDEFQAALADVTALRIRGEFINGEDTGCMDYAQLGEVIELTTPYEKPPTPIPPTDTPGPTATATTAAAASPTAPPAQTFAIQIGLSVSQDNPTPGAGSIESPGAQDIYSFSVPDQMDLYFAAQGETGRFVWTLTAPDGAKLFENQRLWDGNDPGIFTLMPGTYTLTVNGEADAVGTYRFAIRATGTGGEYALAPNTVVFDGSMDAGAGRIDAAGETDTFTFTLTEAAELYFAAQGEENRIVWTLTAPDGTALFENSRLWDGNDPGVFLLEAGTYTITVTGQADDTGIYQFALWIIPEPQTFTLTLNAQVYNGVPQDGAGNIETPGAKDSYTFALDTAQNVYFSAQGEQNRMLWTLTDPNGVNLFENQRLWDGNDPGAFALEAGTYTVTASGDDDDTGTYQFGIWIIPEPQTFEYEVGTIVAAGVLPAGGATIETPGAVDVYTFTLDTAQDLYFAALGEDGSIVWTLTDPNGAILFENQRLWNGNDPGVFTLEAGTYTITVAGVRGDTGAYQFEVTPLAETSETPLDFSDLIIVQAQGNIGSPGAQEQYTFTVELGQQIFIDGQSGDITLRWTLTDPNGAQIFDQYRWAASNVGLFTLDTGGEYTLTVSGNQDETGPYEFAIWLVPPPQVFNIEIGQTILEQRTGTGAGNIESPGAVDVYQLNAESGQQIFIDGQAGDNTLRWILTDQSGSQVFDHYRYASSNVGLLTLDAGGQYTLTVSGMEEETGAYRFRIWDVPEPEVFYISVGEIASAETLGEGAGNIESPGAVDVFNFDAEPGQTIFIEGLDGSLTLRWILTDEAGNQVFDLYRYASSTIDPLVLEAGGSYTLTVFAIEDETGQYRFKLWDVPESDTFEIEIGQQVVSEGNIETPGVQDVFLFTADAGQTIYLDGQAGEITLIWNLADENGSPVLENVFRWAESDVGLVTLDAGGQYTLTVSAASEESGAYRFQIWDVPEPDRFEIAIGDLISSQTTGTGAGNIETPGVQDIYTFAARAGTTITIEGMGGELTLIWNLVDETGAPVFENTYRYAQSTIDDVVLSRGGTYTLTVTASESETGTYQFRITSAGR